MILLNKEKIEILRLELASLLENHIDLECNLIFIEPLHSKLIGLTINQASLLIKNHSYLYYYPLCQN